MSEHTGSVVGSPEGIMEDGDEVSVLEVRATVYLLLCCCESWRWVACF